MKITNPDTREYLSLGMPQWLGVLESIDEPLSIITYKSDDLNYFLCAQCLVGELHNFNDDYSMYTYPNCCEECLRFCEIDSKLRDTVSGYYASDWQDKLNGILDNLVAHMKECHPVQEVKIPMEIEV